MKLIGARRARVYGARYIFVVKRNKIHITRFLQKKKGWLHICSEAHTTLTTTRHKFVVKHCDTPTRLTTNGPPVGLIGETHSEIHGRKEA